jgi:hypothetical protein
MTTMSIKLALRYSDTPFGMSGRPAPPVGVNYTDSLRKGQKNNPIKTMHIPVENKNDLKRRNSRSLARAMVRAGGANSQNGAMFNAMLQERGVNSTLMATQTNRPLANALPDDLYKQSMYNAFYDELTKIAFSEAFDETEHLSQGMPDTAKAINSGVAGALGAGVGAGIGLAATKGKVKGWGPGLALGGGGAYLAHDAYTGAKKEQKFNVMNAGLNNNQNKTV